MGFRRFAGAKNRARAKIRRRWPVNRTETLATQATFFVGNLPGEKSVPLLILSFPR